MKIDHNKEHINSIRKKDNDKRGIDQKREEDGTDMGNKTK